MKKKLSRFIFTLDYFYGKKHVFYNNFYFFIIFNLIKNIIIIYLIEINYIFFYLTKS